CNIGTLFAFVLVAIAVILLRYKSPHLKRPFKVPFVPLIPLLGIGSCIFLMANLVLVAWIRFIVWLAIGLIIYFIYGIKHTKYAVKSGKED
ncbi:MAG: amino acid permease C-terminal domain-containing protein, partial [Candidatus Eremiobacterota bacterium]